MLTPGMNHTNQVRGQRYG